FPPRRAGNGRAARGLPRPRGGDGRTRAALGPTGQRHTPVRVPELSPALRPPARPRLVPPRRRQDPSLLPCRGTHGLDVVLPPAADPDAADAGGAGRGAAPA